MAPEPPQKVSVYEKRKLGSIPAPLQADSDSDFNDREIFVPEPKKRAKRKSSATSAKSKGKGRSYTPENGPEASFQKRTHHKRVTKVSGNPLLEYFNDLGLHSASEDEAEGEPAYEADYEEGNVDEDEEDGDEEDEDEEGEEVEEKEGKNMMPFVPTHDIGLTSAGLAQIDSAVPVKKGQETSETESDSDTLVPFVPPKRRLPSFSQPPHANKRAKSTVAEESSTESDTEDELTPAVVKVDLKKLLGRSPASSSTESDPELSAELEFLHPRPALPLPNGMTHYLGPLILDAGANTMVPGGINTYLREYQREGVRFFFDRWKEGRGGLLGDDMGLGKTIQVIAFLSAVMHKLGDIRDVDRRRKHISELQDRDDWKRNRILPKANSKWPTCLIICPAPVVGNWQREFETWGYFELGFFIGERNGRREVLRDFKMGRLDVLITTPALARKDIDLIFDLPFSIIIVDEVHNVKNPLSKTSKAFNSFDCLVRFGLTGTAIQNDYMELWTILDWTHPGMLGTKKQWRGFVANPLKAGQSRGSSEDVRAKAMEVAYILKEKLLPKFFLRRTKDIIKHQLPEKVDQVVFCPLSATQIVVYKRILATLAVQGIVRGTDLCECGSKNKRKTCCHPILPGDILRHVAILLKLSNHLALILPSPDDTPDQMERNRALSRTAFPDGDIPKYGPAMMQPKYCGKWLVLETLLQKWRQDPTNKVLIFTKSVKLLNMMDFHLKNIGYGFLKLEGATPAADRMGLIDQFNNDPSVFVFLISTAVGGTGLNLQGANRVVIFDPNWNPAHDLQAMDRAYRFGQTRDVHVYRLLGAGSLEELIYARQVYKQQQMAIGYQASIQTRYFDGVQGDAQRQGELFGVKNIFKLHQNKLATKQAIEKANIADFDWALANMTAPGNRSKRSTDPSAELAYEADVKGGKDENELRGLGALLFDDAPPPVAEEDDITKALNAIGVKYSHQNDAILQPSRVEEARSKALRRRKEKPRRPRGPQSSQSKPVEVWPPRRSRITPKERLRNRQNALIALGMISGPDDISAFAQEFKHKTLEEQNRILAMLDKFASEHK